VNVLNIWHCFARVMTDFVGRVYQLHAGTFFLLLTKYFLISQKRNNYAIAIYNRFPASTLPLHHVAAMSFNTFRKWRWGGGCGICP